MPFDYFLHYSSPSCQIRGPRYWTLEIISKIFIY